MIKAVIFDQDGTIFDNEFFVSKTYADVVRQYGKSPVFKENGLIHSVGMRGDIIFKDLIEKHGIIEDLEVLRTKRRELHLQLLDGELFPMPGVVKLLKLLKKNHIKIALVTGSAQPIQRKVIEGLKLEKYFDAIVHGGDYIESKPHSESFLLASRRLNIAPEDCLVIEDSLPGVIAAKRAGMKVIAVPTRYSIGDNFSPADRIIKSLEEVDWEMIEST